MVPTILMVANPPHIVVPHTKAFVCLGDVDQKEEMDGVDVWPCHTHMVDDDNVNLMVSMMVHTLRYKQQQQVKVSRLAKFYFIESATWMCWTSYTFERGFVRKFSNMHTQTDTNKPNTNKPNTNTTTNKPNTCATIELEVRFNELIGKYTIAQFSVRISTLDPVR